jgi:hypothetical protein
MNRSIILKTVMALSVVLSLALACYGKVNITSASAPNGGCVLMKGAAGPVGRGSGRPVSIKTPGRKVVDAGPVGQL